MIQRYTKSEIIEKELQALSGMIKLRYVSKFRNYCSKFKKSAFQTKVLKSVYEITCFPSSSTRKDLAILLTMPEKSVQIWFQNTRQADKRSKISNSVFQSETVVNISIQVLLRIMKNARAGKYC